MTSNSKCTFHLILFFTILFYGCSNKEVLKPNILWITIEDTSPQFIGCYGNEVASTPNIDQLANEGIRFTNAFSTGTVCSPSRTAIITGVKTYTTGTGHHRSKINLPESMKGFPYYLRMLGYYTSNNKKTDYNVVNEGRFITEAWNESSGNAGWWNRQEGQPFFSVFNYTDSHQSRTMTETYEWYEENVLSFLKEDEIIGDNEFKMPPFYRDSPEMRRQFARVYNALKLTDNKIGELLDRLKRDHLMDSTIIFFFADHGEGIPRGKTNGINLGYRVPFVIWFPEMYKHLSPWGNGGVVSDELIDFTDLAPTLISLAGGNVPDHLSGSILLGKERDTPKDHLVLSSDRSDNGIDMVRTVTDGRYIYSRNFMPYMPEARYIRYMEIGAIKQQMRNDLKNGRLNVLQQSLFEQRPPEFLFDITLDKWETKNLINDPDHRGQTEQFRENLNGEVLSSRDIMFLPEYEISLINEKEIPYNFRLKEEGYTVGEIYKAASLSGFTGHEVAQQQIALLNHQNKVVRYWAITGLRSQSNDLLKENEGIIKDVMMDEYPPVALTGAAIYYQVFGHEDAEKRLKEYCNSENMDLALMAINFLLYEKNKTPFVETIQSVYEKSDRTYNVKAACLDFLGSIGLVPNHPDYRK